MNKVEPSAESPGYESVFIPVAAAALPGIVQLVSRVIRMTGADGSAEAIAGVNTSTDPSEPVSGILLTLPLGKIHFLEGIIRETLGSVVLDASAAVCVAKVIFPENVDGNELHARIQMISKLNILPPEFTLGYAEEFKEGKGDAFKDVRYFYISFQNSMRRYFESAVAPALKNLGAEKIELSAK